jgi:hypothetical protein
MSVRVIFRLEFPYISSVCDVSMSVSFIPIAEYKPLRSFFFGLYSFINFPVPFAVVCYFVSAWIMPFDMKGVI